MLADAPAGDDGDDQDSHGEEGTFDSVRAEGVAADDAGLFFVLEAVRQE